MSVTSKIKLPAGSDASLRLDVDFDPVFCGDKEFEFIVALWRQLRAWVKERDADGSVKGIKLGG